MEDKRTEWEKGFAAGIWYSVELLTLHFNDAETARRIVTESGIKKWEFEKALDDTEYERETLTEEILDQI